MRRRAWDWTPASARDVKVVPLHAGTNATRRTRDWDAADAPNARADETPAQQEAPEVPPASEAGQASAVSTTTSIKIRVRRRKRVSPAAVLARALDGPATRKPEARHSESEDAFWPVWLEHRSYLRAHSLRFSGGNVADAEDALSEAMLKAAQSFSPTKIRNHRGWLLRLVHNACMDRHRRNRRQQRVAKDIMDGDARAAPAVVIQPDRSPEELLAALEQIDDLRRAMGALPAFLAEPLLLYLDERPDSEIAFSLNVSKEVVRKRRQIARTLLRQHILP